MPPRGAQTARVVRNDGYLSAGRIGGANVENMQKSFKNINTQRKRDNSDLQGPVVNIGPKKGNKGKNVTPIGAPSARGFGQVCYKYFWQL